MKVKKIGAVLAGVVMIGSAVASASPVGMVYDRSEIYEKNGDLFAYKK